MESLSDFLRELIASEDSVLGLALIAASATVEYVFPPFPGDTITLFAAVLITAYGWSFPSVFGAVMIGSVVGSMAAFYFGGWLERRRRARRKSDELVMLDRLVGRFRRYGAAYLVVNRFLPGIRALFFVAAGMAGMRAASVLLYSTLSAALYNLGLIAVGGLVGANFDTLLAWMRTYTVAMWIGIGAILTLVALRFALRRRRARKARPPS